MDTGKGSDPAARVCPRCGEDADEQRFCGGCGLNLAAQHELPTRAKWETTHAAPVEHPSDGAPVPAEGAASVRAGTDTDSSLPPAQRVWRDFMRWFNEQSKGGKIAFVLSTTLATTVAVILVLSAIIVAVEGGGSGSSAGNSGNVAPVKATVQNLAESPATLACDLEYVKYRTLSPSCVGREQEVCDASAEAESETARKIALEQQADACKNFREAEVAER